MSEKSSVTPHAKLPLSGKWALVTGGSGGIGAAIAKELAAAGANLILHANRHAENAVKLAYELKEQNICCEMIIADFGDEAKLSQFIVEVEKVVPIDILVNTAGVDVLTGEAARWSFEKKFAALWRVDVHATVVLSRALGSRMRQRGSGAIINIGWSQAEMGMGGDSGEYFATIKGAVMAFTRSLARSLAPQVRVNCVAPGWIKTKWGETAPDYWQDRAVRDSLLKRWGQPEDVAKVVRFLASNEAAFVTGQIVNVDGGYAGSTEDQAWN